jgi:hypothetical protein
MNPKCTSCSLSTGKSIHGQSEVPLNQVLLVLISAYPSTEEIKQDMSLAPSPKYMNAGRYCRSALSAIFDSDPFFSNYRPFADYVFFTNAIRCCPLLKKEKRDITKGHIEKCRSWFDKEMTEINPGVPILIAGSEPVKSLLGFNEGMYDSRRKVFNLYKDHPTIVTLNPIEPSRYHPNDATVYTKRNGKSFGLKDIRMMTPITGSPPYLFKQDLILVKDLVRTYIERGNINGAVSV